MRNYLSLTYLGSISALGVATCCILPMIMILFGLGGSWLAVFGKISATSLYVLLLSTALIVASWGVAVRRGALQRLKFWLAGSTALTALAWAVYLNESRLNDFIMQQM